MADYTKVEHEIDAGRFWRAKEILQGRLYQAGYDTALFERYGDVLLQMGDLPEAGKYLFLSGIRKPAYAAAIAIYLNRHGQSTSGDLYGTFPAGVRSADVAFFPESVVSDLDAAGHPLVQMQRAHAKKSVPGDSQRELVIGIALGVLFLVLFAGFLIQSVRGLGWLLQVLTGT